MQGVEATIEVEDEAQLILTLSSVCRSNDGVLFQISGFVPPKGAEATWFVAGSTWSEVPDPCRLSPHSPPIPEKRNQGTHDTYKHTDLRHEERSLCARLTTRNVTL